MNIQQAKQIPLEEFLQRLGYEPSRRTGDQVWYLSPLRQESTPSFKINQGLNAWYDFGEGHGGDIIDLVKSVEGISNIPEALRRIDQVMDGLPVTSRTHKPTATKESTPTLEVISIGPILSRSLRAYLRDRGIMPERVADLVQEIHYKRGADAYFGLAFANNSGGYEIRNPYFKGTLGAKDITRIDGNPSHAMVFEGFFDLLTAVELNGKLPHTTIIVLNSNSLREKAADTLCSLRPDTVELFRDRDASGEQLLDYFRNSLPESEIVDKSAAYFEHKDLNEWFSASRESVACIA